MIGLSNFLFDKEAGKWKCTGVMVIKVFNQFQNLPGVFLGTTVEVAIKGPLGMNTRAARLLCGYHESLQ